jgi:hypothetical protein
MTPVRVLGALLAACGALIVVELAIGGLHFGETTIADACTTSASFDGSGSIVDSAVQGIALSAISGAACELGTSREELVLSFVPATGAKVKWDRETINKALRAGIRRAVEDRVGSGFLGGLLGGVLEKILADPLAWLLDQTDEPSA